MGNEGESNESKLQVTQENRAEQRAFKREPSCQVMATWKSAHMRPQVLAQSNLFCVSAFFEPSVENNSVL